jgi:DNA-directed RNA polymerase specialized sigma24 family protein
MRSPIDSQLGRPLRLLGDLVGPYRGRTEVASVVDDRHAADRALVERLRDVGYDKDSRIWRELADRLVRYALPVLVAWGGAGKLGARAARYPGGHRVPAGLVLAPDDARALAHEVLIVSLEKFRTTSLATWDPAGGASLTTYFVGRCLCDLPDVFAAWDRRERQPLPLDRCIDDGRFGPSPDEEAEARVLVDEVLENDPELRKVLELQAAGYSLTEIAKSLGETVNALRSRTFRARQRIRKEVP